MCGPMCDSRAPSKQRALERSGGSFVSGGGNVLAVTVFVGG